MPASPTTNTQGSGISATLVDYNRIKRHIHPSMNDEVFGRGGGGYPSSGYASTASAIANQRLEKRYSLSRQSIGQGSIGGRSNNGSDISSVGAGSTATRHWVNSVSDIYGPDEIEELLDDLNKLELAAFETEELQDFDINGSQVGGTNKSGRRQRSKGQRKRRKPPSTDWDWRGGGGGFPDTAIGFPPPSSGYGLPRGFAGAISPSLSESSWDSHAFYAHSPTETTTQDHPIFPLTVSGLGGAGNSFGGGGLDIEYEPTLTADDEIDGDERADKDEVALSAKEAHSGSNGKRSSTSTNKKVATTLSAGSRNRRKYFSNNKGVLCFCDILSLVTNSRSVVRILLLILSSVCLGLLVVAGTSEGATVGGGGYLSSSSSFQSLPVFMLPRFRALIFICIFTIIFTVSILFLQTSKLVAVLPYDIGKLQTIIYFCSMIMYLSASTLLLKKIPEGYEDKDEYPLFTLETRIPNRIRYMLIAACISGLGSGFLCFICVFNCGRKKLGGNDNSKSKLANSEDFNSLHMMTELCNNQPAKNNDVDIPLAEFSSSAATNSRDHEPTNVRTSGHNHHRSTTVNEDTQSWSGEFANKSKKGGQQPQSKANRCTQAQGKFAFGARESNPVYTTTATNFNKKQKQPGDPTTGQRSRHHSSNQDLQLNPNQSSIESNQNEHSENRGAKPKHLPRNNHIKSPHNQVGHKQNEKKVSNGNYKRKQHQSSTSSAENQQNTRGSSGMTTTKANQVDEIIAIPIDDEDSRDSDEFDLEYEPADANLHETTIRQHP